MKKEITRILLSLLGTIVLIVFGVVSAKYINNNYEITNSCITYIRLISAGLIAWSVFGRLYNFESWDGTSPTEITKKTWFVITYSLGFYGVIVSLLLFANGQT